MDTTFSEVASKVAEHYPLKVKKIHLLSYKGKKAVWSINTDIGEVILKKVPFHADDVAFMIFAIDFLRSKGVNTPGVFKTADGKGWVEHEGENFVVFEAVHGHSPEYENKSELRLILQSMAAFHKASEGIESPTGKYPSTLAGKWEHDKRKRFERLAAWKAEVSLKRNQDQFDKLFLQHVDMFLEQCQASIAELKLSGYDKWVEQTLLTKRLCHQDYAAGNLLIGDDGRLYVYDMDTLTVDAPIRDMRKILNKVMKKNETGWNLELMILMIKAYQEINPLTADQYRSLAADLLYPHLFYGQVSKYYEKREEKWTELKHLKRLKDMIATEQSKSEVLKGFLSRLDEVISHE